MYRFLSEFGVNGDVSCHQAHRGDLKQINKTSMIPTKASSIFGLFRQLFTLAPLQGIIQRLDQVHLKIQFYLKFFYLNMVSSPIHNQYYSSGTSPQHVLPIFEKKLIKTKLQNIGHICAHISKDEQNPSTGFLRTDMVASPTLY